MIFSFLVFERKCLNVQKQGPESCMKAIMQEKLGNANCFFVLLKENRALQISKPMYKF